jgi:hypothetical protein
MKAQAPNPLQSSLVKRIGWVLLYIVLLNGLYFLFLKSVLLVPTGWTTTTDAILWGVFFFLALFGFSRVRLWGRKQSLVRTLVLAGVVGYMTRALYAFSMFIPTVRDQDGSWVRVEMIKTPYWLWMHISYAPVVTAILAGVILWMIAQSIRNPKSRALILVPASTSLALIAMIGFVFRSADEQAMVYIILFVTPALVFWLLISFRLFRPAFLMAPLLIHSILTGLFYGGYLPLSTSFTSEAVVRDVPGARMLVSSTENSSVIRSDIGRQVLVLGDTVYYAYGPMGKSWLASYERGTGERRSIEITGLLRDIRPTPDSQYLLAVNWQRNDLLLIEPKTLEIFCTTETSGFSLITPWGAAFDGDRVFLSNVTPPIVARLRITHPINRCSLALSTSRNLLQSEYLDNTDGVYGLHLDQGRNRLYAITGFFDGKYLLAVTEMDPDTLEILRDVRIPSAAEMFPLPGTDRILVPSYYLREIYEISLDEMRLIRTIPADASSFGIVYDEKRRFVYSVSRVSGKLSVIDYASGDTLARYFVGRNPGGLALDTKADRLYLGSSIGLIEIALDELVRGL